ncbi:hypothetical protein [Asticcacaulis sp.]|uniref:hypothetical protein n=1 Tax=Asticcacaulis sp. TaxID=1872648 RepID=UPI003F7C0803
MHDLNKLKSISEIFEVDVRTQATLSYFDHAVGQQLEINLIEHHASISAVTLNETVPEEVCVSFEVAKNLYLYTYFVYRFGVVANGQALQSLEYALREKAKQSGHYKAQMLSDLMKMAIDKNWLSDDAFRDVPGFVARGGNRYVKTLAKTLPGIRNTLAHGSFALFEPHRALEQLRICAVIINWLFR